MKLNATNKRSMAEILQRPDMLQEPAIKDLVLSIARGSRLRHIQEMLDVKVVAGRVRNYVLLVRRPCWPRPVWVAWNWQAANKTQEAAFHDDVCDAMRRAVEPQKPDAPAGWHVHHDGKEIKELRERWLCESNLALSDIVIKEHLEGIYERPFMSDPVQLKSWSAFHAKYAVLKPLPRAEHMALHARRRTT
jgi:hypothetical protein